MYLSRGELLIISNDRQSFESRDQDRVEVLSLGNHPALFLFADTKININLGLKYAMFVGPSCSACTFNTRLDKILYFIFLNLKYAMSAGPSCSALAFNAGQNKILNSRPQVYI